MANLFANLPLPGGNGPGAPVATDGMGVPKTITVEGTFPGATITIEASVDGGTVYAPVAVFQSGDNQIQASFSANFMRINVSGRSSLNPFSANVDVAAPDSAALFANVTLPAGNGVGPSLDTAAMGTRTTFVAGGSFAGAAIRVEISEDNVGWAPLLQFTGQGGLKNAVVTAQFIRARVSGRTPLTPFSGTLSIGAAGDPTVTDGITVFDETVNLGLFTGLNFTGAGVTATDAGGGVADITIPGGGGEPTTEHLTGTGAAPIDLGDVDTSFLECTGSENTQEYDLADGTVDGQIHNFLKVTAGNAIAVVVASIDPGEAGGTFTSSANNASFSLVWNDSAAFWQVLGTPRNFLIS